MAQLKSITTNQFIGAYAMRKAFLYRLNLTGAVKAACRLFGLFMLFGMMSAQAATPNKITALSVINSATGEHVIKVDFAEPLANLPAGFTINKPPRIALDFPGTENALGRAVQEFATGDLRSANIVQAGSRTRLVINLGQMLAYDAKLDGNSVLITLHGKVVDASAANTSSRFADARPSTQQHALSDVDFRRSNNGAGRIQVDLSDAGLGIDIRRQGTKLIVDFLKTSLPQNLQRKLDVVDFATPVQTIDTYTQGGDTRMVIEPKGNWEHSAYQTDSKFIVEVKQIVEEVSQGKSKAGYDGEKLTLNFQDITVREALNVIADFTELNMVISDSVEGKLTLRLKDVPWDQALDIILQSKELDMRRNGNVIRVAPRKELAEQEKILTGKSAIIKGDLNQNPTNPAGDKSVGGDTSPSIISKDGSVNMDARTNTLFVRDTPTRLEDVRRILKQIDVPARQVLIEARVVEATDGFARNLGVKLGFANNQGYTAGVPVAAGGANGVTGIRGGMTGGTSNINLPAIAAAPAANLFQFSLFNAAASKILNIELNAMESDDQGKIISSPRVVSADKDTEWALIEQGVELPYFSSSANTGTNISFKLAVLRLEVKTNITPDNNVDMTVKVQKDSPGAQTTAGLAINKNTVQTKVLVENGGTVVIGGVYKQSDSTVVNKVPLLGDIPVLGYLFKSKGVSTTKSELLVFLTPKILQDSLNLH